MKPEMITKITELTLMVVAMLITAYVIPWLRTKIESDKLEKIKIFCEQAVRAAEQIYILRSSLMSICSRQHMLRTSPGLRSLLMKFWKYGSPYLPVTENSSFALSLVQSKSGVTL